MPQPGYVYFMHAVGTDIMKIGKTTNILKRLRAVDQGVPFTMQLVSVELVHDMDRTEDSLKKKYRAYNIKGEWFKFPPEILKQWPLVENGLPPLNTEEETHLRETRQKSARDWLQNFLKDSPMPCVDVIAAAEAVGISERSLRRAKMALEITSYKEAYAWYWRLNIRHAKERKLLP